MGSDRAAKRRDGAYVDGEEDDEEEEEEEMVAVAPRGTKTEGDG